MELLSLFTDTLGPKILSGLQFEATRYAMGTLTVFIIIWVLLGRFIRSRKIRARTPKFDQIKGEVRNSVMTICIFVALDIAVFEFESFGIFKIYGNDAGYSALYFWLSIPMMLILHDTYFYWTHRMMHHPKLYKAFHMTHHRSHNPTPFTAYSFAPGEAIVEYAFVPIILMIVPIHHTAFFIVMTIMIFKNALGHCGYEVMPRRWARVPVLGWMTSVTHHDMHHEKASGNYALYFTWWDRMMGTEHANYLERFENAGQVSTMKTTPVIVAAE